MTSTKDLLRPLDRVVPPDLTHRFGEPPARSPIDLEPHRRRPVLAAVAALAVTAMIVGVLVVAFRTEDAAKPGQPVVASNGLVAYVGEDGDRSHLFLGDPDGGPSSQLTFGDVRDNWPSWSPDGTRLAFSRMDLADDDRSVRLAVLDVASGTVTYVTGPEVSPARSDWAPDGSEIAFARVGEPGIWAVGPDGSGLRLVAGADMVAPDEPHWSPDGRELAFSGNTEPKPNNWDIYIVNADGSDLRNITPTRVGPSELVIDWTLDGSGLFASVGLDSGPQEWVVVDRSGAVVERIYETREHDQAPALSPDGRSIVFWGYADDAGGPDGAFVLDLESGQRGHVADQEWHVPAWQPVIADSVADPAEASSSTPPLGAAAPLVVTCSESGVTVQGSPATYRPGGFVVSIDDSTGATYAFFYNPGRELGPGAELDPAGTLRTRIPLSPGEWVVGCFDEPVSLEEPPPDRLADSFSAPFEVVDPDGLHRDPEVKVMVLNGTRVAGLGTETDAALLKAGFQLALPAQEAEDQPVATSTVYFVEDQTGGNERQAVEVAASLEIAAEVERLDDEALRLVGERAGVVVVLGEDFVRS